MATRIVVGITGASGIALATHFLRVAAQHDEIERIDLVVTRNAIRVAVGELGSEASSPAAILAACGISPEATAKIVHHSDDDVAAPIASGSFITHGMVVIPCSAGTLGSIANGISRGLIQRAADLTLKERRRLVLALRETPLSLIHAENIVTVTRAGAIVMPPVPAFYIGGESWEQYLDHFAMRVLDLFGIDTGRNDLRWKP